MTQNGANKKQTQAPYTPAEWPADIVNVSRPSNYSVILNLIITDYIFQQIE